VGCETREATTADLEQILAVQRRAFGRVARDLGISSEDLPPLTESLGDLIRLHRDGVRYFVAEDCGTVVGSVRAAESDGAVEIGRLVVDDGWERRGVATRLMDHLEAAYPSAERFVLFTGTGAVGTLALYERRGYARFRTDNINGISLVWLQKPASRAVS